MTLWRFCHNVTFFSYFLAISNLFFKKKVKIVIVSSKLRYLCPLLFNTTTKQMQKSDNGSSFASQNEESIAGSSQQDQKKRKQTAQRDLHYRDLSAVNRKVLDLESQNMLATMSARCRTVLQRIAGDPPSSAKLYNQFIEKRMTAADIRSIGDRHLREMQWFIEEFKDLFELLATQKTEKTEALFLEDKIKEIFYVKNLDVGKWDGENGPYPFLTALYSAATTGRYLTPNQVLLIRNRGDWFGEVQKKGFAEFAQQLDLSLERIRQIEIRGAELLIERLKMVAESGVLKDYFINYFEARGQDFMPTSQIAKAINEREGTAFTGKFVAFVMQAVQNDNKYTVLGYDDNHFKDQYFFSAEFLRYFDVDRFLDEAQRIMADPSKEDRKFDCDTFLSKYAIDDQYATRGSKIRNVIGRFLSAEFPKKAAIVKNTLVFLANRKFIAPDYAMDALNSINRPANITEIVSFLHKKYPKFAHSPESIRHVIIKNKKDFICFSKTGVYGLRKWETEKDNIKGGTIKRMAETYMAMHSEPQHYYDIATYVQQFRPDTTPASVKSNLQIDRTGRFVELRGGFWALDTHDYANFAIKSMPTDTVRHFKSWLAQASDPTLESAVEGLATLLEVRPSQARYWISRKLNEGSLLLEDDKLVLGEG